MLFDHPDTQNQFQPTIFIEIEGYRGIWVAQLLSYATKLRQTIDGFVISPLITLITLPLLFYAANQDRRVFMGFIVLVLSAYVYVPVKNSKLN